MLATTIGFSILRDGSELVVFIIGARAGGQVAVSDLVLGFVIGIAGGLLVGALIYNGILRASVRHIFTVVTVLLAFLAAGLMAQAVGFLSSAGFLPPLVDELWDTEEVLSQRIGIGQFLHALLGYMSQPSGLQLAVYVVTLLAVGWLGLRRLPARPVAATAAR